MQKNNFGHTTLAAYTPYNFVFPLLCCTKKMEVGATRGKNNKFDNYGISRPNWDLTFISVELLNLRLLYSPKPFLKLCQKKKGQIFVGMLVFWILISCLLEKKDSKIEHSYKRLAKKHCFWSFWSKSLPTRRIFYVLKLHKWFWLW